MRTKNLTPFPFGTKVTSRRPPRPELVLVLRAAFVLEPGKPLALPEGTRLVAQGPMRAEVFREGDDARAGECLYPGDFADLKLRADVMLRGTCHTPGGKPLPECPVRFAVGAWGKNLRVIGRRMWSDDLPGAVMSDPLPFTSMPVDYAHALGGPGYAKNPAGKGVGSRELPNVEHAGEILRGRRDDPGPAGFGPVNPAWPPRTGKAGREYGKRWRKERWPWYAEDFDWSSFNAAPLDQQLEGYLRGDEALVFQNLHPAAQVFETRLPGLRIRAFVKDTEGRFREAAMRLDTLFADLDEGRLYLTWRGLDAIETDDRKDVATVLVASEKLDDPPLPEAHYRGLLEAFEADPQGRKERFSPELLEKFEALKAGKPFPEALPAAPRTGPSDPLTDYLRKQLAGLPSPNKDEQLQRAADAIAQLTEKARPYGDLHAKLAEAVNDVASRPPNAMPLRPGGPAPAWVADGIREARERVEEIKRKAAEKDLDLAGIEKLDELFDNPFFASAAEPRPVVEPGPGRDLSGQDLRGKDLRGANLRGAVLKDGNLAGADLAGADLTDADLTGAVLTGADLTGANFTGARLTLANLTKARAPRAIFAGANLDRAFLQRADLSGASLAGAKGEATFFPEADLTGADARGLTLFRAFGRKAILVDARFEGASLTRCLLLEVDAKRVDLRGATLTRSSFTGADLTSARLGEARGERTVWLRAVLSDADFGRAELPRAHFMEASAGGASFRRASIKDARCYRASFERADFTEANLFGADLTKCSLAEARFTRASLYDAKLVQASGAGVDFNGANLKRSTLEDA